ncbi:MAG: hypothetical protein QG656_1972 [Candidatus Hydrogenedentes bacterium]|nr:hypothetical protein [Candidatus Hydrogenedentota bacterium]
MKKRYMSLLCLMLVSACALTLVGCPTGGTVGTMAQAIQLVLGTPVDGVLTAGSVQYFKFTAKKDTLYEVLVKLDFPLLMTLMKADGTILQMNDENAFKAGLTNVSFLEDGDYYLRLEAASEFIIQYPAYSDPEMATYDLVVREPVTIENVAGDQITALTAGVPLPDQKLDFLNYQKFYSVNVPATEADKDPVVYRIATEVSEFGMGTSVQLYDKDKNPVGEGEGKKRISDFVTISTGVEAATYYVRVSSYWDYKQYMSETYLVVNYSITFAQAAKLALDGAPTDNLAAAGGTFTLNVKNDGAGTLGKWTAGVNSNGWLTIKSGRTGENAGTIELDYAANTQTSSRTATVYVNSQEGGAGSAQINVTQAGVAAR